MSKDQSWNSGPFTISFSDGICRRMHAETLDQAIEEAKRAVEVTGRARASILCAETYHVIGGVKYLSGGFVYQPGPEFLFG